MEDSKHWQANCNLLCNARRRSKKSDQRKIEMRTTNENTQSNHNPKPTRLAFLAVLMLMTFVAAVVPAAAQSGPALKSIPTATVEAVPVAGPTNAGTQAPGTNNGYCLYRIHGWYYLTCNWGLINSNSTVVEAISEYYLVPTSRFIGSASMQIYNIAPYAGGVKALVFVNWGSDLDVRLDVLTTN